MTWTSLFAAIKGSSSPRFQDELMRSHPVAINGLWMHTAVQSCYQSAICVQLPDRSGTGVTEPTPQIGFWLCARSVVSDDWPLSLSVCVWSLCHCDQSVSRPLVWCYPRTRLADDEDVPVSSAQWLLVQDILPPPLGVSPDTYFSLATAI